MVAKAGGLVPTQARLVELAPGVGLAVAIAVAGGLMQAVEERLIGHAIIEGLVVALLLGMVWRTAFGLRKQFAAGVSFTAKQVLEFAIVLLGASVDFPTLLKAGPGLLLAIVIAVMVGISASVAISRLLGLNPRLAVLIAVGNSICGNSAIAAVAPVIHADAEDVASSIALTAVLGVAVVLTLPLLIPVFALSFYQYGVFAGMTVYAVPQVLAATFAVSTISGQVGTLVKLVRVLLLGPVVLFFSLRNRAAGAQGGFKLTSYVPWFIIGFLLVAAVRSFGLLPSEVANATSQLSKWLTVVAMAALGLGVDIRSVRKVGARVATAVLLSLLVLGSVSLALIFAFGIRT